MSDFTNRFAAPRARDVEHTRRAQIAPLLAAGMSVRAISAGTAFLWVQCIGLNGNWKEHGAAAWEKRAGCFLSIATQLFGEKEHRRRAAANFRGLTVLVYER